MRKVVLTLFLLISAHVLAGMAMDESCAPTATSSEGPASSSMAASPEMDIVDTLANAGMFTNLVTSLQEADLVDTLKSPGPFTIFAPTDEAFSKIPEAELTDLMGDKEKLKAILSYHVVTEKIIDSDLTDGMTLQTVQGANITITIGDAGIMVEGANVTKEIETINGVIHVIDSVIFPPE